MTNDPVWDIAIIVFSCVAAALVLILLWTGRDRDEATMDLETGFESVIALARDRFPLARVWGEHIQGGEGYALFVSDNEKKACFQLRSRMTVDGKEIMNDIRESPNLPEILRQGFSAVEKALYNGT